MRFWVSVAVLLCLTAVVRAGEPLSPGELAEEAAAAPDPLPPGAKPVAIHILTRQEFFQHFYSISQAEVDNLTSPQSVDPHGVYKHWGILGYGSSKPGAGLTKLNRVLLTTNGATYATFYIRAPDRLSPQAKIHPFPVWVWERQQPGLVPVYGISEDSWRNIRFTLDQEVVRREIAQAYKTRKVRLKNHGIMFYIMPPKPPKPKTAPKSDATPNAGGDSLPSKATSPPSPGDAVNKRTGD